METEIEKIARILGKTGATVSTVMPFGKYKGRDLSEIPESYLGWLNDEEINENLAKAIDKEIHRRNKRK